MGLTPMWEAVVTTVNCGAECVSALLAHTSRASRLYNRCLSGAVAFMVVTNGQEEGKFPSGEQWSPIEVAEEDAKAAKTNAGWANRAGVDRLGRPQTGQAADCLRRILERQLAVRAEDSDDDDDADRTYAFPPPVDLDAYAAACRLPPAEETEDEREARFQRECNFGL